MSTPTLSTIAGTVGETVTDAVATGREKLHDLASSASREVPELTDKVTHAATHAARRARRQMPLGRRRHARSRPSWTTIVAVAAALAVLGTWLARRRRHSGPVTSGAVTDLHDHSERARVAATG